MPGEGAFLGRGWGFPPSFGLGGGEVATVAGAEDVRQSLEILFSTAPGERVMHETFGADLSRLMFEELDQSLANAVERLVGDAVVEHEPRVKLDKVEVARDPSDPYGLLVHIYYTIKGTNSRFNLVFPFYRMEATPSGA